MTNGELLQAFEDAVRLVYQDPDSAGYREDESEKADAEATRLRGEILARMRA